MVPETMTFKVADESTSGLSEITIQRTAIKGVAKVNTHVDRCIIYADSIPPMCVVCSYEDTVKELFGSEEDAR